MHFWNLSFFLLNLLFMFTFSAILYIDMKILFSIGCLPLPLWHLFIFYLRLWVFYFIKYWFCMLLIFLIVMNDFIWLLNRILFFNTLSFWFFCWLRTWFMRFVINLISRFLAHIDFNKINILITYLNSMKIYKSFSW